MQGLRWGIGLVVLSLAACGGGRDGATSAVREAPLQSSTSVELDTGCDWFEVFREGTDYYSLADRAARYWVALGPTQPDAGTRLLAQGRFPTARYFSFHVYDGNAQSRDALADVEIDAEQGLNPFRLPDLLPELVKPRGQYTLSLAFEAPPLGQSRPNNTLYRGRLLATDPRQRRSVLMYREYLPTVEPELPELSLQTADGRQQLLADSEDRSACAAIAQDYRLAYLGLDSTPSPARIPAEYPPRMRKFQGALGQGEGAFVNRHVSYLYALPAHRDGEAVLLRFLAPRVPAEQGLLGALLQPAQLRFWSVCQQGLQTAPVVGCVHDVQANLDADGYATMWISRESAAPSASSAALPLNYLEWGDEDRGFPVYRHMLPEANFPHSIQAVSGDDDVERTMQDYAPRMAQCSAAELMAAAPSSAAELFAACEGLSGGG